ncbi:hypothetical protein, partial [Escherichia coli]|uniref:hypothetical protein n=1 Tax=Escherichia coli TaxID=562 RepID=UPI0019532734
MSDQNTTSGRISAGWFPTGTSFNAQVSVDRTQDDSHMRGFQRLAVNRFDPAKTPASDSRYD